MADVREMKARVNSELETRMDTGIRVNEDLKAYYDKQHAERPSSSASGLGAGSSADAVMCEEASQPSASREFLHEVQGCVPSCDWPCSKCNWEKCRIISMEGSGRAYLEMEDGERLAAPVLLRSIRNVQEHKDMDAQGAAAQSSRKQPRRH